MDIAIVACGVFQPELDLVLPELAAKEFPEHNIRTIYLEMALHNDIARLKPTLSAALGEHAEDYSIIALYGSMCHPEIKELCGEHSAYLPSEKNCIDMFVSEEDKERLSNGSEAFFLTHGWFVNWQDSLVESGWDTYDARMNFGRYDTFLLLDAKMKEYTDEELIDFFEFTTVPIEIETITLDRFTSTLRESITSVLYGETVHAGVRASI